MPTFSKKQMAIVRAKAKSLDNKSNEEIVAFANKYFRTFEEKYKDGKGASEKEKLNLLAYTFAAVQTGDTTLMNNYRGLEYDLGFKFMQLMTIEAQIQRGNMGNILEITDQGPVIGSENDLAEFDKTVKPKSLEPDNIEKELNGLPIEEIMQDDDDIDEVDKSNINISTVTEEKSVRNDSLFNYGIEKNEEPLESLYRTKFDPKKPVFDAALLEALHDSKIAQSYADGFYAPMTQAVRSKNDRQPEDMVNYLGNVVSDLEKGQMVNQFSRSAHKLPEEQEKACSLLEVYSGLEQRSEKRSWGEVFKHPFKTFKEWRFKNSIKDKLKNDYHLTDENLSDLHGMVKDANKIPKDFKGIGKLDGDAIEEIEPEEVEKTNVVVKEKTEEQLEEERQMAFQKNLQQELDPYHLEGVKIVGATKQEVIDMFKSQEEAKKNKSKNKSQTLE